MANMAKAAKAAKAAKNTGLRISAIFSVHEHDRSRIGALSGILWVVTGLTSSRPSGRGVLAATAACNGS